MSRKLRYVLTDVFAESKYSGNQLATFLDGSSLSGAEMQQIAREINFSETTFILPGESPDGEFRVRIFTPGGEVDFAGHPTLGSAYVIRKYILQNHGNEVRLNLNVGQVPVTWSDPDDENSRLFMRQIEPTFGDQMDADLLADVLGLSSNAMDTKWPVEVVSTGLPQIMVPLKNMKALKQIKIRKDLYEELILKSEAKIILVFSPGGYTRDQALGVRVFCDYFGIPEDPATGSGNGCLAAYLVKHRYFGSKSIDIQTGQGYEIGRPSTLALRASNQNGRIQVEVGGRVIPIAEGLWQ
jgi:trans-2,3-dihydro-3-hydroxyanthranilate isomerase